MATKWAWCVALAVLADDDMEFAVEKETGDRGQVARRWWTRPWILERHLDASNTMFKLSKDLILVSSVRGSRLNAQRSITGENSCLVLLSLQTASTSCIDSSSNMCLQHQAVIFLVEEVLCTVFVFVFLCVWEERVLPSQASLVSLNGLISSQYHCHDGFSSLN